MSNRADPTEHAHLPAAASDEARSLSSFHVMFQMNEPTQQPWGDAFRGRYTLPAILEILAGFEKNGVRLRVLFLEDVINASDWQAIKAAFASLGRDEHSGWLPVFPVCPMMYAAAGMLDRSVGELSGAKHFTRQPDQVINGDRNALGFAVMCGWRPDIAIQLAITGPSVATLSEALRVAHASRESNPDNPYIYQRECRDAVIRILEGQLKLEQSIANKAR